jgi:dimethylargininase
VVRNEGGQLKKVIVCSPKTEYFSVPDLSAHNIEQPADIHRAIVQHRQLCTMMQHNGAEVIDVGELPGHPNFVFTRDTCVCTPGGFVQLRMGLASRQGEGTRMAQHLVAMGIKRCGQVFEPGTIEGGDIILAGRVAFIGRSMRSDDEGVEQVRAILEGLDYEVRIATVSPSWLHIGGMMSMIGPHRMVCCEELFPDKFFSGFETIAIPAENFISGNVICLSEDVVIAEKSNTSVIARLEDAGVRVLTIDLSEFIKGKGGPTCLIMPLERASG